jgi:hypothetical protein
MGLKRLIEGANMYYQIKKYLRQVIRAPYLLSDLYYYYVINTVPRYKEEGRLLKYGFKVYSQGDEDGIIREIMERINVGKGYFVEFGVSDGLENNTTYLLLKGWKGVWIEGNRKYCQNILRKFRSQIDVGNLTLKNTYITRENILQLFEELKIPQEFELISIDIDGNDYWIWETLINYKPKIVVMEYNATFRPDCKWIMKYNPHHVWRKSNYFGASLKSLEELGVERGYKLVGCSFSGMNAFFVREDLIADKFVGPFTSENHYEPPRYFVNFYSGQPADFGDFES